MHIIPIKNVKKINKNLWFDLRIKEGTGLEFLIGMNESSS